MSADERRAEVLEAALIEFARGGLYGATTSAIAKRVGVSQPYLFRLFPTKHAIFTATMEYCFHRIERELRAAAEGLHGPQSLSAMRERYRTLLKDTALLQFQLQIYATALDDAHIRELGRTCWARLWRVFSEISGGDPETIATFFGRGLLANVLVAFDIPFGTGELLASSVDEWAVQA